MKRDCQDVLLTMKEVITRNLLFCSTRMQSYPNLEYFSTTSLVYNTVREESGDLLAPGLWRISRDDVVGQTQAHV